MRGSERKSSTASGSHNQTTLFFGLRFRNVSFDVGGTLAVRRTFRQLRHLIMDDLAAALK
jgi:hypothetical protein